MTTLTLLKARIADDIIRSDLTTQIGEAITDAITHYQATRFWFNVTRLATFTTVAAQSLYATADDADIPNFIEIDDVFLNDGSNERRLSWGSPAELQYLLDSSGSSGTPYAYSYFEQSFRLYPIPDAARTVRPIGLIQKAAPATDGEANNVWMLGGAFELIRCRAKAYLAAHVMMDLEMAQVMVAAEDSALRRLRRETMKKSDGGMIEATTF